MTPISAQLQADSALPCAELSADVGMHWHYFGAEQVPVLQLDNFLQSPEQWRDYAGTLGFAPEAGSFYPGVRAPLAPLLGDALRKQLAQLILQQEEKLVPENSCAALAQWQTRAGCFSQVTTAPQQLRPIQSIPHFDDVALNQWALLIYLCGPEQGGTGFYQHRATAYERITRARLAHYGPELKREMMAQPALLFRYMNESNALFLKTGEIDAAFNRAIFYPSNCLHSGLVKAYCATRLTANFLFCNP